jgi:hypothetical protein
LIGVLHDLLADDSKPAFSTMMLMDKLNKKARGLPAMLFDRLQTFHNRHIILSKMADNYHAKPLPKEVASLHLRFSLAQSEVSQDQIQCLARNLASSFYNAGIPLCRIDYKELQITPTATLPNLVTVIVLAKRWLSLSHRRIEPTTSSLGFYRQV